MDWVKQLESYQRRMSRQIAGYGNNVHDYLLNIQQAYHRLNNSFDQAERIQLWRCIHLLATDLAAVTDKACPEPEGAIYKQLERE
jgi:hypothetical protein